MNCSCFYLRLSLYLCSRSQFFLHIQGHWPIFLHSLLNYQNSLLQCLSLNSTLICPLFMLPLLPFTPESIPIRLIPPLLNPICSYQSHHERSGYLADQHHDTVDSSHLFEAPSSLGFKETTLSWLPRNVHWLLLFRCLCCFPPSLQNSKHWRTSFSWC